MVRNRFEKSKVAEESVKREVKPEQPDLLNEFAWDFAAIARKRLKQMPESGAKRNVLSADEQRKVDQVRIEKLLNHFHSFRKLLENSGDDIIYLR